MQQAIFNYMEAFLEFCSVATRIYTVFRKTPTFVFLHNSYKKVTNFNENFRHTS